MFQATDSTQEYGKGRANQQQVVKQESAFSGNYRLYFPFAFQSGTPVVQEAYSNKKANSHKAKKEWPEGRFREAVHRVQHSTSCQESAEDTQDKGQYDQRYVPFLQYPTPPPQFLRLLKRESQFDANMREKYQLSERLSHLRVWEPFS